MNLKEAEIGQVINRLPDAYKQLILLRHASDLSYDEIAEVTSLPLGTVKTHVLKAKEKMKSRMAAWQTAQKEVVTA